MRFLTYEEYKTMGGTLEEAAFLRYSFQGQMEIDHSTFGRVQGMAVIPEAVKFLLFQLILLNQKADVSGEGLSSESVGGWSKSYKDIGAEDYTTERLRLIESYLSGVVDDAGTPLLYRGCSYVSS